MHRKPDARETILQAAEAVVAEAGAVHLTFDAVAERAGVSKGGLLYHFPSKEALLQGMVAHLLAQSDAQKEKFRSELGEGPAAELEAHIRTAFAQDPAFKRIASALLAAGANDPKLLKPVRDWQQRNFRQMAQTRPHPIRAAVIMMALDGVWFNEVLQTSPLSAKQSKELLREILQLAKTVDRSADWQSAIQQVGNLRYKMGRGRSWSGGMGCMGG